LKAPAFQFYVRDWLCSLSVMRMTGDQVKAYMYLLSCAWLEEPRASLPNDNEALANYAKISIEKWDKIKKPVLAKFEEREGRLFSARLLECSEFSTKQTENGKKGGRPKAKENPTNKPSDKPSTSPSTSSSLSTAKNPLIFPQGISDNFTKSLEDFIKHRKSIKKPMTQNALDLLVKKLKDISGGNVGVAIKILETSIINGWSSIYELKGDSFKKPGQVTYSPPRASQSPQEPVLSESDLPTKEEKRKAFKDVNQFLGKITQKSRSALGNETIDEKRRKILKKEPK